MQCPVCSAEKLSDNYFKLQAGTKSADFLYSRVCRYAKKEGCINRCGKYDQTLDWMENFNGAS